MVLCKSGSKSAIITRVRSKMATVSEGLAAPQEEIEMAAECEDSKDKEKCFAEVRRKRKRKLKSLEMEVEGEELQTAAKRPSFPPVTASSALVRYIKLRGRGREGVLWSQMIKPQTLPDSESQSVDHSTTVP